jgi:hypothetical protein
VFHCSSTRTPKADWNDHGNNQAIGQDFYGGVRPMDLISFRNSTSPSASTFSSLLTAMVLCPFDNVPSKTVVQHDFVGCNEDQQI